MSSTDARPQWVQQTSQQGTRKVAEVMPTRRYIHNPELYPLTVSEMGPCPIYRPYFTGLIFPLTVRSIQLQISTTTGITTLTSHECHVISNHPQLDCNKGNIEAVDYCALYYYNVLTLSQEFQPMAAQLSMKAALQLAKILATTSCRSRNTELWSSMRA